MTVGDMILFEGDDANNELAIERMIVGSLVSGTTYNVTRNDDGSGANAWSAGTPFAVMGQSGDYVLEVSAGSAATLGIRLLKLGSTWSATNVEFSITPTEIVSDSNSYFGVKNALGQLAAVLWEGGLITGTSYVDNSIGVEASSTNTHSSTASIGARSGTKSAGVIIDADSDSDYVSRIVLRANQYFYDQNDGGVTIYRFAGLHFDPIGPLLSWPGVWAAWHGIGLKGAGSAFIIPDITGMEHDLTTAGSMTGGGVYKTGYLARWQNNEL